MKALLFIGGLFIAISGAAQSTFSEVDAKQIINTFFEGFHTGDTTMMKSVMAADIVMQTAYANKSGEHKVHTGNAQDFVNSIGSRPETQKWEERLLDYRVQIDGNLAHVWTPYEFWLNGEFSHCGANAFTLVNTDSGWKILHLIDSRRRSSCGK
ncbi:MAG: nuclear transport factor 2 family protein [Bacteroidota bacterium]